MPIEDLIFSGSGGFLFGVLAGYAIKKVMKIAAVIIGLFIAALAYLSYRGLLDVKWTAMENFTRHALTDTYEQTFHAQFAAHTSIMAVAGLPVAAGVGFVPGLMMGLKRG